MPYTILFNTLISFFCWLWFPIGFGETHSLFPIYQRIKPVFHVNIEGKIIAAAPAQTPAPAPAPAQAPAQSASANKGEQIYQSHCVICHGTGVSGAPKFGDKAAWEPRVKQGEAVLLQHVTQGYNVMPPKGTCTECSDVDLKSAIEYMLQQSGAGNAK